MISMFCSRCGAKLATEDKFCFSCGAAVSARPSGADGSERIPGSEEAAARLPGAAPVSYGGQAVTPPPYPVSPAPAVAPAPVALDWQKGLNGLVGYVVVQVILTFVTGRSVESIFNEWPLYAFYAAIWTTVFALGFSTGASWGIVLAVSFLDLVLFGFSPIFNPTAAFMRVLMNAFVGTIVLAIVGLIRGRLEWIGLHDRGKVSQLFAIAGGIFVLFVVLGSLLG
jgi:hypothetical protein